MPSNTIVMPIDIKQNRNALSKVYGHYFPEVHCRQTLSTYGLAKHMADHGSLVSEEILRLVLGQLVKCVPELLAQGIPVKLDATVMRGTAFTVNAIRSISDALRILVPEWRILRTCVPGRMTKAERIGAEVLDANFPGMQFQTVIHQSAKVGEGSWQWAPVVEFNPGSRPAKDYLALAEEVLHG